MKRRLRELIRQIVLPRIPPVDLVVRASPPAYRASFPELRAEVERAVREIERRHAAGALAATPASPSAPSQAPPKE